MLQILRTKEIYIVKNIFKWGIRGLGVLVVVVAIGAAWNWERLVKLYNVNTLFDEGHITANFSNMEKPVLFNTLAPIWAGD